jgi:hypothetical protein
MDDETFLRVFAFSPSRPGLIDSVLRDDVLPELARSRDLLDVYAGRHGPGDTGERVVVSIWSAPEPAEPIRAEAEVLAAHPELSDAIGTTALSIEPIALGLSFEGIEEARILRLFEGDVRDGAMAEYIEDVRRGAMADAADNRGLVALYLACRSQARFLTVSAWTGWDGIEAATGGDVVHPIRTRHSDRLTIVRVQHYEVLPETRRPVTSSALAGVASR